MCVPRCYSFDMRFHLSATVLSLVLACAAAVQAAPPVDLELATEQRSANYRASRVAATLGGNRHRERAHPPANSARQTARRKPRRRESARDFTSSASSPRAIELRCRAARSPRPTVRNSPITSRGSRPMGRIDDRRARPLRPDRERNSTAAHADLAQPIDFATKGQPLRSSARSIAAQVCTADSHRTRPPNEVIRTAAPVADEVGNLTAGTGLAIMLHSYGLALRPEKSSRRASWLCASSRSGAVDDTLADRLGIKSIAGRNGPDTDGIPQRRDRRLHAPRSHRRHRAANQAADLLGPRGARQVQDRSATIQVHVPRTRTFYKRILDRVLIQGRLAGQLRVDEAGTAFLWITK